MGREEGSGWGTHVCLWRIHFDIWQNQYNIVKLKNKIKLNLKNCIFITFIDSQLCNCFMIILMGFHDSVFILLQSREKA